MFRTSDGLLADITRSPKSCCRVKDTRLYAVTVRQLLQHQGGWDRDKDAIKDPMFKASTLARRLQIPSPASCLNIIYGMLGEPLQFAPGTSYAYSNFGYCILGVIIERITKQSYEAAVRTWLLEPAGVNPDEMYLARSQLKDIPPNEVEYQCDGTTVTPTTTDTTGPPGLCATETSVFGGKVLYPYGVWSMEASPV